MNSVRVSWQLWINCTTVCRINSQSLCTFQPRVTPSKWCLGSSGLLRSFWVPGILSAILASIPSTRLNSFREALSGFSKKGKILKSSSYKYTVPRTFFWHFYAFAVVWTALLLSTTWIYAYKIAPSVSEPSLSFHKSRLTSPLERRHAAWRSVFLLLLMEIQVSRRVIETIYVFKYSPSTRMHISIYLASML
ncbi:polyprenol reductase 2-like [Melia azedarach]|uniref:Polyprenol reductase 2-like n=1 Tax=Melia azedarach TaxID=155640 RepID=A0ACC1XYY4_MELAZ|nr:polyprenol reductase 2-like [Melia azedarach]